MTIPTRKRSGFTLIELLTVIAIIGILAAVLFPGVQGVMKKAKMSTASTKVRNIGQAYISFASTGNKYIKSGTWSVKDNTSAMKISEWAAVLAYNAELNTAELWYVDADKKNETAAFPKKVLSGSGLNSSPDPKFSAPGDANGFHSWVSYVPVPKNMNESLPLLWTRGLGEDGAWDVAEGVWGSDGGHIAWGDSHVTWVSNTSDEENKFNSKKTPGETTASWKDAVSSGTATLAGD